MFSQPSKSREVPKIHITPVTTTLDALDLHSPTYYNSNNGEQRKGFLGDSSELDLASNLNYKCRSDTHLCEDGNANKTRVQNLNWTKTFANIDNKYNRAKATTNQEAVKKKLNLIQRRISMELKVGQLEKAMQSQEKREKKASPTVQLGSPTSPTRVKQRVEELKSQLKTIDEDLKATDEQREVAIKGIKANKNKEYDVIQLLEETARGSNKSTDKTTVDDIRVATIPKHGQRNSHQFDIKDKKRITERRRTISRLQAFSNALDIRRNFKSVRKTNKNNNNDNECHLEDVQVSKSKASQNSNQGGEEKKRPDITSETSYSEQHGEIQMVISQRALQEIAAFERRIEDYMKRRQEYDDFLYIDQDE